MSELSPLLLARKPAEAACHPEWRPLLAGPLLVPERQSPSQSGPVSGKATPHDVTVSHELATVLSGGDTDVTKVVTEKDLLALEREAMARLFRMTPTLDRIEHMLATGKPLRN